MKVSRNWLQTFFDSPLPDTSVLEEGLTFHSSEIEEVITTPTDVLYDIKVLPDKSPWLLSHRGIAREIATILNLPIPHDPFLKIPSILPETKKVSVTLDTEKCSRYAAALIRGVTVGPSPEWLQERLEAIGQRSINNVVDATNYIMFHLGQPLHAFDAQKLTQKDDVYSIGVRQAHGGEKIIVLTGEEYTLTSQDMVIMDHATDMPIGIAGVKGGMHAAVGLETTDIIIESANFDRVSVRKTAQRHRLRTDASVRYENGILPSLVPFGITEVVALIQQIAGGTLEGYVDVFPKPQEMQPVSVSISKINAVLGLELSLPDVQNIMSRFGYQVTVADDVITVLPPFERDDLHLPEDVIEEVGRIHGLSHVPSKSPVPVPLTEYNKRFFYAEQIRDVLVTRGFSEVYTSSFRKEDQVKLANALAEDKAYLRSALRENLMEALDRNVTNKDLLGLQYIALFEIGAVFPKGGEHISLCIAARAGQTYSQKRDDVLLQEAIDAINQTLGSKVEFSMKEGIAEVDLDAVVAMLSMPHEYTRYQQQRDVVYTPFPRYPFIARDIALWVGEETDLEMLKSVLKEAAGDLLVRLTQFDSYKKDGRISYAFRLVFQSSERTLTNEEVNSIMDGVTEKATEKGWEVR